jgi:hypothetical protein
MDSIHLIWSIGATSDLLTQRSKALKLSQVFFTLLLKRL